MSELARQLIAECQRTKSTYLDLGNCGLTDLGEIPELFECVHLEELVLSNEWYDYEKGEVLKSQNEGDLNIINILPPDFSALKKLNKLVCGGMHDNEWAITDISHLKSLRNLTTLNLSHNQIKDFSALKDLGNLTILDFKNNKITDISALKDLSNLTILNLGNNQITDIPSLIELRELIKLNLSHNQIKDFSSLKDLGNLTILGLNNNQITDISALKDLQSLTSLYLNNNQITDISTLKDLQSLTTLHLSFNQITDISALKDLRNLTTLNLGNTQITDISYLKDSVNLTNLDLSYSRIADIYFLKDLVNLANLNLGNTQITDLSILKNLRNLTNLDLSYSRITDIYFLKDLVNLANLDLGNTQITDLSILKNLRNLTNLYLKNNQIKDISHLRTLVNLTTLDLGNLGTFSFELANVSILKLNYNQVTDISSLKHLGQLTNLCLSDNQISDVSYLKDLKNLTQLDLSNNQLHKLPEFLLSFSPEMIWEVSLSNYNDTSYINLYNNPIENVPIEIIQQGKAAIRRYLDEERGTPLNEAKLLILGEGNAGKSTMVEKLLDPDYTLTALPTTHGIVVRPWHFEPYTAHIWDFGGQAIYQATHRFFLTQRSLYVLLTDNRAEDTDFNYWFEKIALFGGDSPLVIVQNERDNRKKELSASITGASLKNLKQVVQVNFADNRGLPELIHALKTQFCSLAHINQPFPKRWRKVREALEGLDENHISWDMYSRLCKDNGIPEKEVQSDLCRYLHDLGILLHFEDSPLLKKTVFLQPDWVTGAVYHLLDFIGKGLFTEAEAAAIWSAPENNGLYDDMHAELLAIISKFEICYAKDQIHILPQLLTENAPAYTWHSADNLQLIYRYGFMPQGILWRLMVRLNRYLPDTKLVWKKGAIFFREEAKAEITEENTYLKREIRIRVSGKFKKEFLTILLEELENIHRSYHFEKVQEESRPQMLVPCNCGECRVSSDPVFYEYSDLRRRLTKGKDTIECKRSYELCHVRSLLDDVFIAPRELEYLGKWEEGRYELRMLRMEKLNYLKKELIKEANPEQKFSIKKKIEELENDSEL
jgi:Leucine-rich repeat (LRR) protein